MKAALDTSQFPLPEWAVWNKETIQETIQHNGIKRKLGFPWNYGWVEAENDAYVVLWAPYTEPYLGAKVQPPRFDTKQEAAQFLWLKFLCEGEQA